MLMGDSRLLLEMGDRELRRCHWAANRGHLIFDTLFFLLKRLWGRSRQYQNFINLEGEKGSYKGVN